MTSVQAFSGEVSRVVVHRGRYIQSVYICQEHQTDQQYIMHVHTCTTNSVRLTHAHIRVYTHTHTHTNTHTYICTTTISTENLLIPAFVHR